MNLRYTGQHGVCFVSHQVGYLEPGDEFSVPDDAAPSFLTRPDVEEIKATLVKRKTTPKGNADGANDTPSEG